MTARHDAAHEGSTVIGFQIPPSPPFLRTIADAFASDNSQMARERFRSLRIQQLDALVPNGDAAREPALRLNLTFYGLASKSHGQFVSPQHKFRYDRFTRALPRSRDHPVRDMRLACTRNSRDARAAANALRYE